MTERFDSTRIHPVDFAVAESWSLGSAIVSKLPERLNVTGKADDVPSYVPARWRHLRQAAGLVEADWVRYEGHGDSGRTPRNYPEAAIILVDREAMDWLRRFYIGPDAVAFKLGSTVMAGSASKQAILGLEHPDDEDYKVGMRVGKGPLVASVGLLDFPARAREAGSWRPGSSHAARYYPLLRGVRRGPTVSVNDFPVSIPLV